MEKDQIEGAKATQVDEGAQLWLAVGLSVVVGVLLFQVLDSDYITDYFPYYALDDFAGFAGYTTVMLFWYVIFRMAPKGSVSRRALKVLVIILFSIWMLWVVGYLILVALFSGAGFI